MIFSLNGEWQLKNRTTNLQLPCTVPGSVYSTYLQAGEMEDPYYRDNEMKVLPLMDDDYTMSRTFIVTEEMLTADSIQLQFLGLDTICVVYLNGIHLKSTNNMHRTYTIPVKERLNLGENCLEILFKSPSKFIKEAYATSRADGTGDCTVGFPLIRKAHCMFGWDWGPRLPDAGIWRDVQLLIINKAEIKNVHIRQTHQDGKVTLNVQGDVKRYNGEAVTANIFLTSPTGETTTHAVFLKRIDKFNPENYTSTTQIEVESPSLWWPNGLGEQPLYTVRFVVSKNEELVAEKSLRIGLRTMTVAIKKDEFGESFAHQVNGVSFFGMGADYIPEDCLITNMTQEKTRRLLEDAKRANFNVIRVWGGGHYPADCFFDICDELGLVVWQDFMFACAVYNLDEAFEKNITEEIIDNVIRIRHHASLGLWCGNNEMEMFVKSGLWVNNDRQRADYIKMYEYLFPKLLKKYDPDTFYWPASPSSGGSFDEPNDENRGDVHYWDVWHGNKPFTEYRKFYFRYVSEFGFQAFPDLETVERFTLPEDRNIFSFVMEKHQRNDAANGKIMNYLAQTYRYPNSFEMVLYTSQLLSAQAVQYGVEHWRRHRGRCMGAIIWQLNDCWPVASWASIDYNGRWKALHYAAKRFFAPVLLSCQEEGMLTQYTNANHEDFSIKPAATFNVSNEQMASFDGELRYSLVNSKGETLQSGTQAVHVDALSASWYEKLDFSTYDAFDTALYYSLHQGEEMVSSTSVLFCAPKFFAFKNPELSYEIKDGYVYVTAKTYAKGVALIPKEDDVIFSDNYFDMLPGTVKLKIERGTPTSLRLHSIYDI